MLKKPDQNNRLLKTVCYYLFLSCLIVFLPACNSENDDYKEVSKLISSRNSARYQKSQKQTERKQKKPEIQQKQSESQVGNGTSINNSNETNTTKALEKKKFSTEIFYQEEIKIISTFSDETLGVGTAYLNKDGKIVQIKIKRD